MRPRVVAWSGLVTLAVAGGTVALLRATEEPCGDLGVGECLGRGLATWLATLVAAYVVWGLALRLGRVRLPWLAPLAIVLAGSAAVAPLDLVLVASVAVLGVLGALWGALPAGPRGTP
jgi:hypothetical protein